MKLYELTENYKVLVDMLNDEGSEYLDSEAINKELEGIGDDIEIKSENIVKLVKNFEAEVKALKEEEDRLKAKRQATSNKIDDLKQYLQFNLERLNIKKLQAGIFDLRIQKNPDAVVITDENAIPENYKKYEVKYDKTAIKNALKAGEVVAGAELKASEGLRIK